MINKIKIISWKVWNQPIKIYQKSQWSGIKTLGTSLIYCPMSPPSKWDIIQNVFTVKQEILVQSAASLTTKNQISFQHEICLKGVAAAAEQGEGHSLTYSHQGWKLNIYLPINENVFFLLSVACSKGCRGMLTPLFKFKWFHTPLVNRCARHCLNIMLFYLWI